MAEVADNTLIDGRYRILGRIGSGGMADVYRAEDTHLGREIALKILHRRFAQDTEFVERFRREAKSAAGLSHPNVVGIFDRGEHEGTYYIAMECLTGKTLKEVITGDAPLSQERVIHLGLEILRAAGFAHKRGVIHRDFKPHNVILDDDGHVKVTDFGIARAGASEMTETGSIMGTAQYLSPEQAQGHAVTAASDLYSIGVMLYEMLAGRLPFDGDSAVSIALKHLSEPPPPLSSLRPDIDPALESVIMAALAKNPSERWQSADEFAGGLEAAQAHLAPRGNGQDTAAFVPLPAPVPVDDPAAAAAAGGLAGMAPDGPAAAQAQRRRRRWPAFAIGLLVLAMLAVVAFALTRPEKIDVPKVEGDQLVQARKILERTGFATIKVERVRSLAEFDRVLDQSPAAGEKAARDSTVTLTVSRGPGDVRVPSVENLPEERAVKELTRVELKANIDREASSRIPTGRATRTVPTEGTSVERGTRVRLFISSGPPKITVPEVTGLLRSSAEQRLSSAGLNVQVNTATSDRPKDEVTGQSPTAGTQVDRGTTVTITVSKGQEKVTVPSVQGQSASGAAAALRAAGLRVSSRERRTTEQSQDGQVIDQRPSAGTEVDRGSSVVIVVGRFQKQNTPQPPPAGTGAPTP